MSDKPNIALLHGWGGHYQEAWVDSGWETALEQEGVSLVKLNLPGHGVSKASHNPEDYSTIADEVETVLGEQMGMAAMGYSLGAKLLLELECRKPGRFCRLVLASIGENAFQPLRASAAIASMMINGTDAQTPPLLSELYDYAKRAGNDPKAMAACMMRPQDAPITPQRLEVVNCPVLVINGEEDHIVLPAEGLIDCLSNARLEMIDNVGHFGLLTHPHFKKKAMEFLLRD